jgi:hypothetical protein
MLDALSEFNSESEGEQYEDEDAEEDLVGPVEAAASISTSTSAVVEAEIGSPPAVQPQPQEAASTP